MCWSGRYMEKSLYTPLNFAVNLKLLENNKTLLLENEAIYKSIRNVNFLGRNQTKVVQDCYMENDKVSLCVSHQENEIQTPVRPHFTPSRMTIIKMTNSGKYWLGCELRMYRDVT